MIKFFLLAFFIETRPVFLYKMAVVTLSKILYNKGDNVYSIIIHEGVF